MVVSMVIEDKNENSSRAKAWAETMYGHSVDADVEIRLAHSDSWAGSGSRDLVDRRKREELEDQNLTVLATRSFGAGNRAIEEEPDKFRTCFERDRDRILHASSFRRLAGKTQVFVFPQDHQRTRLTHVSRSCASCHFGRAGDWRQCRTHRSNCFRARLWSRPRRSRQRRCAVAIR